MRATLTLVRSDGWADPVVAEWAGPATLEQLVRSAGVTLPHADASVWVDGFLFAPSTTLDLAGVRDGSTVSLQGVVDGAGRDDPACGLHLAVVAGPGAGTAVPITAGTTVVGRGPECGIRLSDPAVSRRHLALHLDDAGGVEVEDLGSRHGTYVDGEALRGRSAVEHGALLRAGDSLLEVRAGTSADAVLHPSGGDFELRRPPRLRAAPVDAELPWPAEPPPPPQASVPLVASLVPLVVGIVLYLATRQALTLLLVGMAPLLAVINMASSTRNGRIAHRRAMVAHREERQEAQATLARALQAESRSRRTAAPDPATVGALVAGPRRRLWERRRWDDDHLHLRLGLADLPSGVRRVVLGERSALTLPPTPVPLVPAVLPLADVGVLGVAGAPSAIGPVASWLVAQATCLSGPSDVQLVVLAPGGDEAAARWGWARWLPHTAPPSPGAAPGFGTTAETVEARVAELVALIRARQATEDAGRDRLEAADWPSVLVVLDPAYDMRRVPGVDVILKHGPASRVFAICVESAESYLPPECAAVAVVGARSSGLLRRSGRADLAVPALDLLTPGWCEAVGRGLAPLRDPEATSAARGTIPTTVRLLDLLGLQRLDADAVLARWAAGGRSTAAVVGVGREGPVQLDLGLDGPHALVAGARGAGKSELLQTLIASLAVANRHDALNFLLVDHRGGSAFQECARLPHTLGVVTDLDGDVSERTLLSLSAELDRREEVLAAAAAKDLDDYVTRREPGGPLPRLVIVVDELAGFAAGLPDFVAGLVGLAPRGRSLGVHLVLATEHPSMVLAPELRASIDLRIALRVTSASESAEVVGAPDAARIIPATPGRAVMTTGHSGLVPFQAAWVGGPEAPVAAGPGPEVAVVALGWEHAGLPVPLPRHAASAGVDTTGTDLARLATAVLEAAERTGGPRQTSPWRPGRLGSP